MNGNILLISIIYCQNEISFRLINSKTFHERVNISDHPVNNKKAKTDVDGISPSSAVQTACLRHLQCNKKTSIESSNILDDILLELGRIFTKVHTLKTEKGKKKNPASVKLYIF